MACIPGSSSVRLEENFGKFPWYFHVYIWDYHRQEGGRELLQERAWPKTVAIAL